MEIGIRLKLFALTLLLKPWSTFPRASCLFETRIGDVLYTYDLSPLHAQGGWSWTNIENQDDVDFTYYFSACGPISKRPRTCSDLKPSMGYRVSVGTHKFMHGLTCVGYGDEDLQEMNLIDPNDPFKGIDVLYRRRKRLDKLTNSDIPDEWQDNGKDMGFHLTRSQSEKFIRILTPCHDQERFVAFHFICSPHFDGGPIKVFEDYDQCHVNVTWPSRYGCPKSFLNVPGGMSFYREQGLNFYQIGGWYIVGILCTTCALPFICQHFSNLIKVHSNTKSRSERQNSKERIKLEQNLK
mmetsp:Transcript_8718/g.21497  ORF Transcript_8718/g.21497 Transcript_8718/m.21497 type:complete len:296 (-) Transcript_8718:139-1026(-)